MTSQAPKKHFFSISGVDVTDYVSTSSSKDIFDNNIKTCDMSFKKSLSQVLDYNDKTLNGEEVIVKRGVVTSDEEIIFRGYVRSVSFNDGFVKITCEDKLSSAKTIIVNTSYTYDLDPEAGVISEIFKDLLDRYTNYNYDDTTIQNTGSINIVKEIVFRRRYLIDALEELANILDYQFYYNEDDDKIYFEPKGYRSSTVNLEVGVNVVLPPKWDIDSTSLFNEIILQGAPQPISTSIGPYKLDGSQTDWGTSSVKLPNKPTAVKVYCDTNSNPTTEKLGGFELSSTTYDYYVNVDNALVRWNTAQFAPSSSYYAEVEYTYNVPIEISLKDEASRDNYTSGIYKSVVQKRIDIKSMEDAISWGQSQLAIYKEPFYKTSLKVIRLANIKAGYLHQVIDGVQGINKTLMVKSVVMSYPYKYDVVEVSDKEYRMSNFGFDVGNRIRQLEEKQQNATELLTQVINLNRTIALRRRDMELKTKTIDDTGQLIWGHPTQGTWGNKKWGGNGDSAFGDEVTKKLVQGNMNYREKIKDDKYNDSSNTTANFNVGSQIISFTSGQVWQSKAIDIGSNINSVFVTLGITTGSFLVEMSLNNGSTWTTINLGVNQTIDSNDGSGVLIRITETNSSTATIENEFDISGQLVHPAISVLMVE